MTAPENPIQTEDHHIIDKFREMVGKRYDYVDLSHRFKLPADVNEAVIADVRTYFLESIYPPSLKRKELEDAFGGLANYMRHPRKIWGLFGNMAAAVFRFGRHFIQALKAGFASLDAFVGAKKFESSMAAIANKNGLIPPMTDEEFEDCLYQLPKEEVIRFIQDVRGLFNAMINTKLLYKTIQILGDAIETMERKSNIYPQKDINGIRLGRSMLQEGYDLFSKYDEVLKVKMVELIFQNEMWFMDEVYRKKEKNK